MILLVNGSPNEFGCTNRALVEIQNELKRLNLDSQIFWIGKNVDNCTACGVCHTTKECVKKDKVNDFAKLVDNCEGIVFGSPVYFGGCASGMVSFLTRLFYSSRKKLAFLPAASIVSCRRGGATQTFNEMNLFLTINNMMVVGSQYWNQVHGNTPSEVEEDLEGLQTMRQLARNMAWLVQSIEYGKKAGLNQPKEEKKISTNFIRKQD